MLFPRALLSVPVDERLLDEKFLVAAGEWFAEGAIWGIALARGNGKSGTRSGRFVRTHRTFGVGSIVHREFRNGIMSRIVFEGIARGRMMDEFPNGVAASMKVELLRDCVRTEGPHRKQLAAATVEMLESARQVAAAEPKLGETIRGIIARHPHPGVMADLLAHSCVADWYARQCILEELHVCRRVRMVHVQLAQIVAGHSPSRPYRPR